MQKIFKYNSKKMLIIINLYMLFLIFYFEKKIKIMLHLRYKTI